MKAAEAFWAGRDEAFRRAINAHWPKPLEHGLDTAVADAYVDCPGNRRGGRRYSGARFQASGGQLLEDLKEIWKMNEQINVIAEEAATRAITAMERLSEVVDKFRNNIKNDLTSMKAISDRVETEVNSMGRAYANAATLLTSESFERAVANAERMAAALQAIHNLSATRLSMALFVGDEVAIADHQEPDHA